MRESGGASNQKCNSQGTTSQSRWAVSQTLEEVAGHAAEWSAWKEEPATVYQGREGAISARLRLSPGSPGWAGWLQGSGPERTGAGTSSGSGAGGSEEKVVKGEEKAQKLWARLASGSQRMKKTIQRLESRHQLAHSSPFAHQEVGISTSLCFMPLKLSFHPCPPGVSSLLVT